MKPENMDAAIGRGGMLLDTFIYQMAKDIADMSSVMYMDVDYIILTACNNC